MDTFDAISGYPKLFSEAVFVAGEGTPSFATKSKDIPFWIIHSTDVPIVKPKYSRGVAVVLRKSEIHLGYTELPNTGHFTWLSALQRRQHDRMDV